MWITFYYQSKRYKKSLNIDNTKANRKLALNQIIPEIQYKLNSGEFFENIKQREEILTIDDLANISFEIHKNERRDITQKRYIRLYELHIKPHFAQTKVDSIKPSALAKWQNSLLEHLSGKTVKGIRTIFYTMFEDAIKDDLLTKNPFSHIKSPKESESREKLPFDMKELLSIINNAPENIKAFFAVGFFTGMRTGEIIGLKWIDVDFDEMIIKVQRSRRQGIETLPKTKTSIRDVEILDILLPYLKAHQANYQSKSGYVFETYMGIPFNTCDKISAHYWKPLLKNLDIKYRNLYQMRHTFASMMISNGEDILWVSKMLGHKDSSMTLEKYARFIKGNKKKRAQFLEEYVA